MIKDLRNIEIIKKSGCTGCILDGKTQCDDFFTDLTGLECTDGYTLCKKEVWETCTKENTKVGNTVRHNNNDYVVKYIHEKTNEFLLDDEYATSSMRYFKVKVR